MVDETFTVALDTDDSTWPSDWGAGTPSSVEITITDNDKSAQALAVSGSGQDLVEGGDAVTFSVWLTEAPSANVTVTLTLNATNTVALTLIPSGPLTFMPSAWDESNAQTVTVTVPDNAIPEAGGWQRIILAASGGGADGATGNVDFYFRDDDKPELEISGSEPGPGRRRRRSDIFCEWLTKVPSADVTVTLTLKRDKQRGTDVGSVGAPDLYARVTGMRAMPRR